MDEVHDVQFLKRIEYMPTLDQVDPKLIFAMFKGEPGTRKSTQALSFPGPQYWFSWDRKMQGILLPLRNWGIDPKTIEYDDYDDWNTARDKLEKLSVNCPYDTLVFDSITSMADMTLRQTLKSKGGTTRKSGAMAGKQIAGISVNELEDYNAESAAINELISLAKDIQIYNHKTFKRYINIILIAHVMEVTNKSSDNKMITTRTIVTAGKRVAAKIPAYCTEVYHFGIKKGFVEGQGGKYICATESTSDDFARTALPLPKEIEFGDKSLYKEHILPAIDKLKG